MIKIKENCFYNQKTIQFDEAKEELLIINRYLVEENLLLYLDTITFDKENEKMLYNTVELCRNVVRTVMNLGLAFHV